MKSFSKSAGTVGWMLAVTLLIAGCSAPEVQTTRVTISGNIQVADGVSSDGVVHVALYHAWALEGVLRVLRMLRAAVAHSRSVRAQRDASSWLGTPK